MSLFRDTIEEGLQIRKEMLADPQFEVEVERAIDDLVECFKRRGKLLLCGNGGSAADAQHIAAELSGRFKLNREPLFAEALHVNPSFVTAVANDYGYDHVFQRMVRAMGRKGDVFIGITTSGNSKNVLAAMREAQTMGMRTIALLGKSDGEVGNLADIKFNVPSSDTARIQEVHITIGHILCEAVEQRLFGIE